MLQHRALGLLLLSWLRVGAGVGREGEAGKERGTWVMSEKEGLGGFNGGAGGIGCEGRL